MKKIKIISGLTLAALMLFSLAGCGLYKGADARFPYDIATERGYDGSHESWLASFDTPSTYERRLYQEAVAGGYTGTFFDFLKELGLDGMTDADRSAYVNRAITSAVSIQCKFNRGASADTAVYSMGSGVIYSLDREAGDAYIVTNYHVVYNAYSSGRETIPHISDEITLFLYGGVTANGAISATFLGGAMDYDLAVLEVKSSSVLRSSSANALVAADSDSVTVGERTYAIGNAEGEGMSVTEGIVSVDAEYIDVTAADELHTLKLLAMRTDAALNHGNSGGGLYNGQGELIGIVNARSEETGVIGFGYAIPANLAMSVVQNILDNRASRGAVRAQLGITAQAADSRSVYNEATGKLYIEEKITVRGIESASSAANRMGLEIGDTITMAKLTSARGERTVEITRLFKLTNLLFEIRKGDTLTLWVSRDGETYDYSVTFDRDDYFMLYD